MSKPALFERLGGVPAVRAALNIFYDRLVNDERLSFFFRGSSIHSLKIHQLQFFKIALTEIPKDLDVAALLIEKHIRLFKHRGLNEGHFDLVAVHLIETLQSLGVGKDLIDETVAIVGPLRAAFEKGAKTYGGNSFAGEEMETDARLATRSPRNRSWIEGEVVIEDENQDVALVRKLGGSMALEQTIEDLYFRLLSDKALSRFFEGVDVELLQMHQRRFLEMVLSDEVPDFERLDILVRKSHQRLFRERGLSAEDFDRFMDHFISSLRFFFVKRGLINDVVRAIKPMRGAFTEGYFDAERIII